MYVLVCEGTQFPGAGVTGGAEPPVLGTELGSFARASCAFNL